jgi:ribosomal protein S18 acetylase RimI-like enzyme
MPLARHALAGDLPELSRTLASAFFDDPVISWFFEDAERRAAQVDRMMAFSVEAGLGRGHVYTTQNRRAAAIWSPPDVPMLDERAGASFATLLRKLIGSDADERLTGFAKMQEVHPHDSHFYLFSLGTHAEHQGQGLGAQVVAPVLQICDAQGLPAYLESSNPRNIPFYQRHGFELRGELLLAEGGPSLSTMWRDPR